jgi:hypothetical protein
MEIRNTIALPGMLALIATPAAGQDIVWQQGTSRTSGSGYDRLYNLLDAGDFAQNLIVERSDLCGDVTGDGVIDIGDLILLSNSMEYSGYSLELHHKEVVRKNQCLKTLSDTD